MPTISIIIPCLNEGSRIGPTLEALKAQTAAPDQFEILVVDGDSTDNTVEIAQSAGVRVLRSAKGHGRQRNAGARGARARWLAFLDADCTVPSDWIERALQILSLNEAEMVGGPVLAPENGTWVERAWGKHLKMRSRLALQATTDAFRFIGATNMFVERKAFEAVGGFDEELSSGEDTDLGYRLNRNGFRTQFDETLVVFHRGEPKSLRDFFAQQVWYSNREVWRRMAIQGSRKVGQRALRYGILHITGLSAVAGSILIGVWWRRPEIPAVVTLAYLLIPLFLSARAARVTRSFGSFLSLALLYWIYGVARAAYILGLTNLTHKAKRF